MGKPIKQINKTLANKLVKIAKKQLETSERYKQNRMNEIQENEDLYQNKVKKAGRGRFNVPVPVMSGFVDTLMSKIDEKVTLNFKYTNLANLDKSKKLQATWEKESSPTRGNWDKVDRGVKKLAILSGVGIYEEYAESDPEYKSYMNAIDYLDFECEPLGGQNLDKHLYKGIKNVFRTQNDIETGAEGGEYDKDQVNKLLNSVSEKDTKRFTEVFENKMVRFSRMGLDITTNNYVGQPVFSLVKWVMEYEGEQYYLFFERNSEIWIRAHKLKNINKSGRSPWVAWHTHEDAFNFWSKAPADDIRPVASAINILFNQALDNRHRQNYGMRGVDPEMFPDLTELQWKPDGVVRVNTSGGANPISSGIYEFKTPEVAGTIDLINFMDTIVGQKSGVTADAQGSSEEDKVGIYYGNLQQVADRLGLYNKSYTEAHAKLGMLFQDGVRMHMTEGYMIKWIGEDGAMRDAEMERADAEPEGEDNDEFSVDVVGGQAEVRANEVKKRNRERALSAILSNQTLSTAVNPIWAIKEILSNGDYDKEEVQMALERNDGSLESLSRASRAIQDILQGREPEYNRNADTTFIQRIINFAVDEVDDDEIFNKMMAYAEGHIQTADENARRKATLMANRAPAMGQGQGAIGKVNLETDAPVAGTKRGTASMSQELSGITDQEIPGSPMNSQ